MLRLGISSPDAFLVLDFGTVQIRVDHGKLSRVNKSLEQ